MVTNTQRDFNLSLDGDSSTEEKVDALVEIVPKLLQENQQLREEKQRLQDRVDDLEDRVEDLQEDVKERSQHSAQERADICQRLSALEEGQEDTSDPMGGSGEDTLHDTVETPLEEIVALPEHTAEEQLTANQERARFIALDVEDYTRKVPAGRAIKSSEIRKVLKAREGSSPHTETVDRVIDFLERFGRGEVQVVKKRGERRVCFSNDLVERIQEIRTMDEDSLTVSVIGGAAGA
ncbi:hypothetical protein [Halomicrobium urmianum]|uniref:hypothetical protein n=1 Tax=Halomicrobium urmianum TaxID=1586233 RepID=UPI001CD9E771|nr:hypothetical protein [Halomicrobium urmianum]